MRMIADIKRVFRHAKLKMGDCLWSGNYVRLVVGDDDI